MTKKAKETQREKALKELVLAILEEVGDKATKQFFPRMEHLGISDDRIMAALGYPKVTPDKLKAGMWIKVYWYDTAPTWLLLLETPDKSASCDASLMAFDPIPEAVHSHTVLSQVIEFREGPKAPE